MSRKTSLRLSSAAEREIAQILSDSRADFGDMAADDLVHRLELSLRTIEEFPRAYRLRLLSNGKGYRCCVVKPFRIFYTEKDSRVRVIAIIHTARDEEALLRQRF